MGAGCEDKLGSKAELSIGHQNHEAAESKAGMCITGALEMAVAVTGR